MNADEMEQMVERHRYRYSDEWYVRSQERITIMREQEEPVPDPIPRRQPKQEIASDELNMPRLLELAAELAKKGPFAKEESQTVVLDIFTTLWNARHFRRRSSHAKQPNDFLIEGETLVASLAVYAPERHEKRCSLPQRIGSYFALQLEMDTTGTILATLRERLVAWWDLRYDEPWNPDAPRI